MRISKLYKIDDEVVFYKVGNNKIRNEVYNKILNEEVVCLDTDGKELSPDIASQYWLIMCDYNHIPSDIESSVYRNISLYPIITSIVRANMIKESNALENMTKLSNVIVSIQIGLFSEAADILSNMERDTVFTEERLTIWENMLRASNTVE